MNISFGHWASVPSRHHIKKSNCQLYYWATGKRKYSYVEFVKYCNVSLCTDNCFERFDTNWDLEDNKQARKTEMDNELEMAKSNTVSTRIKKRN